MMNFVCVCEWPETIIKGLDAFQWFTEPPHPPLGDRDAHNASNGFPLGASPWGERDSSPKSFNLSPFANQSF